MARTTRRKARPEADPLHKLVQAAMQLASERPWREVQYREIAALAGLALHQAYALAPGRGAILEALAREADRAVLSEPASPEDGDARDRLFDVLMRRFDALRPYRAGLASVVAGYSRDPLAALAGWPQLVRSMAAMLTAAGLSAEGPRGRLRARGLAAIWLATLRDFFRDDSEDLSPTMASLDGKLRRAEGWLQRCRLGGRRRAAPGESETKADAA